MSDHIFTVSYNTYTTWPVVNLRLSTTASDVSVLRGETVFKL